MNATTTRRALLAGAPVAALAAIAAAPAPALASPAEVSPNVAAAIRAHGAALARVNAFRNIHTPIEEAWFAASKAIPHVTTKNSYLNTEGEERRATTEPTSLGMARSILRDFDAGTLYQSQHDTDFIATMREVVEAGAERDAEAGRIKAALGYEAADARLEELGNEEIEALGDLLQVPAQSFLDLIAKVELIHAEEAWGFRDAAEQIVADLRRLAAMREA
jgi:hypothetical protein